MGHKEHIKDENRTIEDFLKIKLYKEGNFWRAYEWSAYLCEFFPNGLSEKDKLKPTYKEIKGVDGGMIFVGLPTNSLKKYFPNVPDSILLKNDDSIKKFQIENKSNMKFEDVETLYKSKNGELN